MKACTCFLVLCVMAAASAAARDASLHKKISVEYAPATIRNVLADIEKKTGVRIAYAPETVKGVT